MGLGPVAFYSSFPSTKGSSQVYVSPAYPRVPIMPPTRIQQMSQLTISDSLNSSDVAQTLVVSVIPPLCQKPDSFWEEGAKQEAPIPIDDICSLPRQWPAELKS